MTQFQSSSQSVFNGKKFKFGALNKKAREDTSVESARSNQFFVAPDEKLKISSDRMGRRESCDDINLSTNVSQLSGSRDSSPIQRKVKGLFKKDLTEVKDRESEEDSEDNSVSDSESDSDESFRETYASNTKPKF